MRRKPDLHIQFFSELTITSSHYKYAPSTKNSSQLTLLLSYLIINQGSKVPKEMLMAILWPERKDILPIGALRNLIYRARKELIPLYPDQDINYIKFTQDAYYWNSELYCKTDMDTFENYYHLAEQESDPDRQHLYYYRMNRLYKGGFLPNQLSIEWIQARYTHLRNIHINCVLNICEHLYMKCCRSELIAICDQCITLYPEEDRFYRYKLLAYLGTNDLRSALAFYHSSLNFFSSKYGTDISSSIQDIYQKILDQMPHNEIDIDELERNLNDSKPFSQTLYCNFDMFKTIYQLNAPWAKPSTQKRYLLLLTIRYKSKEQNTIKIREAMAKLYQILTSTLRRNDIFTRTSTTQYAVILTVAEENYVDNIISRIQKSLKDQKTAPTIYIDFAKKEMG